MKAVIVGAGIGGVAAAIALLQRGLEVELIEQARVLEEVGAGVQISPNGMRAIAALGLSEALEEVLFEPDVIEMRVGRNGRQIFRLHMKDVAQDRWGARFVQVHRADLHRLLLARLRTFDAHALRLNAPVSGYVREHGGASVYLDTGERVFGDVVIGADGVRSRVRAQMHGADRPRFTGNVAWRITCPIHQLTNVNLPSGGCIWVGAGKHAVTTRIRSGTMANFVGVVEQDGWTEEGWTIKGTQDQALADFGDWDPVLRQIIEASEGLHRWALFDRAPLARWSDGPVTLLGDAAHPMLPSMAQGAVQALEDAVVLGLTQTQDAAGWVSRYESLRRDRTAQIQRRSSANVRLFHKRGFLAQLGAWGPPWMAARVAPNVIHRQQDWIYSYDPIAAVQASDG